MIAGGNHTEIHGPDGPSAAGGKSLPLEVSGDQEYVRNCGRGTAPPLQKIANFLAFRGPLGPWESPGTMSVSAVHFGGLYQEIATSGFALLAMTR